MRPGHDGPDRQRTGVRDRRQRRHGVTAWLGVPYAAVPTGKLRWAPPEPRERWSGTLEATQLGNVCPQPGDPGNEDCLNLNVRVPVEARSRPLPVMVEIHGGGFRGGSTSDTTHLAATGEVITVEVNYRVGILGFMAHRGLGAHSGNYGIQDQQAALRWVRENIARFGGDRRNVTIFGSSAGGASVCANAVSPGARGLFQRGISESGVYNSLLENNTSWQPGDCKARLPTERQAQRAGARFAEAVGCEDVECLRNLPAQTLIDAAGNGLLPHSGTMAPIADGKTLPLSPAAAFATGRHVNDITMMFGVERDETQLASATTPEQYRELVRQQYGELAPAVFARYPLERFPKSSPFIAYRTIVADSNAVCPSLLTSRRMSRHIPVFTYQDDFSDPPQRSGVPSPNPVGAYHIGVNRFLLVPPGTQFNANLQAFSDQVTAQWTGYARTGNPTVDGTPRWTRFTPGRPAVMSLNAAGDSEMTTEISEQHNCGFWNSVAPSPL